jgi:hypothetical protein
MAKLNGAGDQVHGGVIAARLMGDDAEQVESFGVVGLDREDLPVDDLGVGETARSVVLESKLESGGDGDGGHWRR